jgi:regulator of CtrA degradation
MERSASMSATSPTAFFHRTYDEAMGLLVEARNYVAVGDLRKGRPGSPTERLVVCCEAMRLTARLTHVMAWLLAQRAVHAGEITLEEAASEKFALGGEMTCLAEADPDLMPDDAWLGTLLERSRGLYLRVARLDEMVRREVATTEEPPPPPDRTGSPGGTVIQLFP